MADLVEGMICHVAEKVFGGLKIEHKNDAEAAEVTKTIDLTRPWRRVRMVDLVEERTGWKFDEAAVQHAMPTVSDGWIRSSVASDSRQVLDERLRNAAPVATRLTSDFEASRSSGISTRRRPSNCRKFTKSSSSPRSSTRPSSPTSRPSSSPSPEEQGRPVLRRRLRAGDQRPGDLAPATRELNDPDVQAATFAHQVGDKEEQQKIDEDFLNALRYGMPPAGGMGWASIGW